MTLSNPPPTELPSPPKSVAVKSEEDGSTSTTPQEPSSETTDADEPAMDLDDFSGLEILTASIVVAVPQPTSLDAPDHLFTVSTPAFKLPSSKSPIMEAMVYCALQKWGIEITHNDKASQRIVFKVTDFENYYKLSCSICSKQTPSEDIRSRMKALQRWFISFPSRKDLHQPFNLTVKLRQFRKVREIIDKVTKFNASYAKQLRDGLDE
jgi:hypothetical protein